MEGAPTKQTPEVVEKIARAIALGLADGEAASLAVISDMTLTTWRRDPEFLWKIKMLCLHGLPCDFQRSNPGPRDGNAPPGF
jgi:hypothetical protein